MNNHRQGFKQLLQPVLQPVHYIYVNMAKEVLTNVGFKPELDKYYKFSMTIRKNSDGTINAYMPQIETWN